MTTTILQLFGSNARQISPAVVNLFQANNNVDSLEFQMTNYKQDNIDLSTLDPYAICYGAEFLNGLDEVKLTSEVTEDNLLRIYWDLTVMTLSASQTITYQIVFKNNEGAVWTSYKGILFCNESLTADEEIVAKYPTILKQMETRIETKTDTVVEEILNTVDSQIGDVVERVSQMAEDFDASVVYIPYGETIPVEARVNNRLYYQYTDAEHTKGRFEDWEGTILISDPTGYATHVGQTIFSLLPINNAGLHLLDGAKLSGKGAYSGFVEYISKLYDKAKQCFCKEDEWQSSVRNYGVCGKFVYDSVENSVRLPKVTGLVEGTIDASALGSLVKAGLPNITGVFGGTGQSGAGYGMFYIPDGEGGAFDVVGTPSQYSVANGSATNNRYINVDFDASRSSSIYGNSNTVQPQTIKGYYYIVIATSVTDEINITNEIELNNPFSLFDVKWSDHEIDNLSWIKSNGSYYPNSIYPSAYDELISEYGSSDSVDDGVTSNWDQPATTDVATPDGDGYVVCSASSENGDNLAWWALDSFMLGTDSWISTTGVTSGWWQVKFPYKLKITGLKFYSSHSSTYAAKDCRFYTSSEMTKPIGNAFVGLSSGFASTTVTGIPEEGVITDTLYLNITSSHGTGIGMGHLDIEAERVDLLFKRTPKGYKITTSDFEVGLNNMYDTDGIAWYYVIDVVNGQFKLPRTKFGFEGVRTAVGDTIEAGLPNITGNLYGGTYGGDGVFKTEGNDPNGAADLDTKQVSFDASRSSSIYGNSNTVQEPATQMNLYFYVGETVKGANLIAASNIIDEVLNKVDKSAMDDAGSYIANCAMPSDKYIELTLGASGTEYTAPTNGWFVLVKSATSTGQYMRLTSSSGVKIEIGASFNTQGLACYIPVRKGDIMTPTYNLGGVTGEFKFFYAEGEV